MENMLPGDVTLGNDHHVDCDKEYISQQNSDHPVGEVINDGVIVGGLMNDTQNKRNDHTVDAVNENRKGCYDEKTVGGVMNNGHTVVGGVINKGATEGRVTHNIQRRNDHHVDCDKECGGDVERLMHDGITKGGVIYDAQTMQNDHPVVCDKINRNEVHTVRNDHPVGDNHELGELVQGQNGN